MRAAGRAPADDQLASRLWPPSAAPTRLVSLGYRRAACRSARIATTTLETFIYLMPPPNELR